MCSIYKIEKYPGGKNTYTVSREEIWKTKEFMKLADEKSAQRMFRDLCEQSQEFKIWIVDSDPSKRKEYLEEFCTSEKHLTKRTYFIGFPPLDKIKEQITQNGIQIICNS